MPRLSFGGYLRPLTCADFLYLTPESTELKSSSPRVAYSCDSLKPRQ